MSGILERRAFKTSRLLDFATQKELTAQTGHSPSEWPLVIVKELIDNSLDACEEAGTAPEIAIFVDTDGITVVDNGPGLPAETVKGALDFTIRVSSRDAYVSPTRGAQGNALKTIFAMPFVLDRESGEVQIEAKGVRHDIVFKVDRIRQEPVIAHDQSESDWKKGTVVRVGWPSSASSILKASEALFYKIVADFAWLNPHLTLSLNWFGEEHEFEATDPNWKKWKPSDPTSPHWYTAENLERLITAHITDDMDRQSDTNIREFVASFRGLSASTKQKIVLESTGLYRARLSDLVKDGSIDREKVVQLLAHMQSETEPVKPAKLGIIGETHFQACFERSGCAMESFEYRKKMDIDGGVPWVLEAAFGYIPSREKGGAERSLITGVNWSPGIVNPFRSLGYLGNLDSLLSQQFVRRNEPIVMVLHFACARVEYRDRGKSAVVLS